MIDFNNTRFPKAEITRRIHCNCDTCGQLIEVGYQSIVDRGLKIPTAEVNKKSGRKPGVIPGIKCSRCITAFSLTADDQPNELDK